MLGAGNKRSAAGNGEDEEDSLFIPETSPKRTRIHETEDDDEDDKDDNGSDNSDRNSDEGEVDQAYNESVEPFPAFTTDIERVKSDLLSQAQGPIDMFAGIQCNSQHLRELRELSTGLLKTPDYQRKIIGFLGDAGEGKSSLINSLSDCPGLAKALDAGQACTFVVMEYRKAPPTQAKQFSATVECHDLPTITDILSSALEDWALFYGDQEGWTQDDIQYHETKMNTCRSMYRAIFSDLDQFKTEDDATETLHRITRMVDTKESKLADYVGHAEESLKPLLQPSGQYSAMYDSDDTGDLWAKLQPYVSEDPSEGEPSYWPLVKKVVVEVQGSRVLNAATLVDMPGVSDTNQARVNATLDYIMKCDFVYIVAHVGRVITSTNVNGLLRRYGKVFQGDIAVVATRVDENVNHALAMAMPGAVIDMKEYQASKKLSELTAARIKSLQAKRRRYRSGQGQYTRLSQEIDNAQAEHRDIENMRWESVVEARNKFVSTRLVSERSQHLPHKKKLRVFCVSNKHYDIHKGAYEPSKFLLSPNGTGVPALRQHILLIAAPCQLGAVAIHAGQLQVLLARLGAWSSDKTIHATEREALLEVVQQPRSIFDTGLTAYQGSVQDGLDSELITPLHKGQVDFVKFAKEVMNLKIAQLPYQTIRAFAARNGKYKTGIMAGSWNAMFTEKSTKKIHDLWETFISEQESLAMTMEAELAKGVRGIMTALKNHDAAVSLPLKAFGGALEGRITAMRQILQSQQETHLRELRQIFIDATVDSGTETVTHYFTKAMTKAYRECDDDIGDGFKGRCVDYLQNHLCLGGRYSPFAVMFRSMQTDIKKAIKSHATNSRKELNSNFNLIVKDFESMTRKKGTDKSEASARKTIKEYLKTAIKAFHQSEAAVNSIKARYLTDL